MPVDVGRSPQSTLAGDPLQPAAGEGGGRCAASDGVGDSQRPSTGCPVPSALHDAKSRYDGRLRRAVGAVDVDLQGRGCHSAWREGLALDRVTSSLSSLESPCWQVRKLRTRDRRVSLATVMWRVCGPPPQVCPAEMIQPHVRLPGLRLAANLDWRHSRRRGIARADSGDSSTFQLAKNAQTALVEASTELADKTIGNWGAKCAGDARGCRRGRVRPVERPPDRTPSHGSHPECAYPGKWRDHL